MTEERRDLEALAETCGIETRYRDGLGAERRVPDGTLLALLAALDAGDGRMAGVRRALSERREQRSARPVPPLLGLFEDDPPAVPLRLRRESAGAAIRAVVHLESGGARAGRFEPGELAPAGGAGEERRLPLPPGLPPGLHRLEVEAAGLRAGARLVVAPRGAIRLDAGGGRPWGLAVPVYALRSARNPGRGDLGDLADLVRWAEREGAAIVATLPLLAHHEEEVSPYRPSSRTAWEASYLPLDRLPELERSPEARARLTSPAFRALAAARRRDLWVDHARVQALVRPVLTLLSESAWHAESPVRAALERFRRDRPEAAAYARFAAERLAPDRAERAAAERAVLYGQFAFERELDRLRAGPRAAGLLLDLPLGVHPEGFDVTSHPQLFARGVSVGAPPDAFFDRGQNWGFPPLRPDAGAALLDHAAALLTFQMRHARALRIDHVMGFTRQFWIPEGCDATAGAYVRYPSRALFALATLLSSRHRCAIVGEDLGTVPNEVRETMERRGWARSFVFALEATAETPLPDPPARSCASLTTHDTPPFAGFWRGADIDLARRLGRIDRRRKVAARKERAALRRALAERLGAGGRCETVLAPLLDWLGAGPAGIVLLSLEDLWLDTSPQNVPGTAREYPNWRKRAPGTLTALARDEAIAARLDRLRAARGARPDLHRGDRA